MRLLLIEVSILLSSRLQYDGEGRTVWQDSELPFFAAQFLHSCCWQRADGGLHPRQILIRFSVRLLCFGSGASCRKLSPSRSAVWRNSRTTPARNGSGNFAFLKPKYFSLKAMLPKALKLLQEPVSALPDSPELRCRLLLDQGLAEYWLSHYPESKRLFDQSFQLAKSHNLQPLIAEIEFRRAATLNRLGDAAGGEADLHDALQRARQSKDPYIEATVLGNLGFLRMSAARYDEAISWFGQSLVLFGQLQAKVSTARVLNNLGQCYTQLGQPEKATTLFERAAQLAADTGDLTDRYLSLGRLAEWYKGNRDYKKAFSFYQQAIDAARQAHSTYWTAKWLYSIAATSIAIGDLAHAEDYNRQAVELEAKVGNPVEALLPQINAARIAEARQQASEAEQTYRSVIRAAEKLQATEAPGVMLEARGRLANLLVGTHRNREAETEFQLALALINARRSELPHYEYRISYLSSLVQFYQDYVDFLVGQHRNTRRLKGGGIQPRARAHRNARRQRPASLLR